MYGEIKFYLALIFLLHFIVLYFDEKEQKRKKRKKQ